jgi:hypothetical protein
MTGFFRHFDKYVTNSSALPDEKKFTKMLEESEEFLCKSKARKSAIIDTVAVTPEAYENALKSKKLKGGFGFSGD